MRMYPEPVSPQEKKKNAAEMRKHHEKTFEKLGLPNAYFLPKLAFPKKTGDISKVITFFISELRRTEDIYIEFASINNTVEDPERRLWKWRYNPHFETEYESIPLEQTTGFRYLVPITELLEIQAPKDEPVIKQPEVKEKISTKDFEIGSLKKESISDQNTIKSPKFTHEETCRIVDLDARDFACLYLKVPESSHEWLNDLITKHRKENLL
jgi:hypothetical protein